jgi:hypothetical protein
VDRPAGRFDPLENGAFMKLVALLALLAAVAVPAHLEAPLKRQGFSSRDLEQARSEPVVKEIVGHSGPTELAVVGVVRIDAPPRKIAEDLRRGRGLVKHAALKQSGVFSEPAVLEDVAGFRYPESDIEALKKCKPGACKFKLGELGFETFAGIDWSAPDAAEKASEVARLRMVEYANNYRARGTDALIVYTDKKKPMSLAKGIGQLIADSDYVARHLPELDQHFENYPKNPIPGVEDHLHWSVEDFGYRPITYIIHTVVYEPSDRGDQDPAVLIAQKHIFTSHYFFARVEYIALFPDDPAAKEPGTYVVYVDRSLFDDSLGTFKRPFLVSGVLEDVNERLAGLRDKFEGGR